MNRITAAIGILLSSVLLIGCGDKTAVTNEPDPFKDKCDSLGGEIVEGTHYVEKTDTEVPTRDCVKNGEVLIYG